MRVLEQVFLETINRESLLSSGKNLTAAVSGGADSVAMLHLLNRFAASRFWCLSVLHINHGLRADSSMDELFVRRLAEQLGLPFRSVHPESAEGGSMESRWSSYRQSVYMEQPGIVAVAHTASDRAETLLLRLFEGSGLRGLGGMDYRGAGQVQRPLLDMHSAEIRNWLKEKNYSWIEDCSNQNTEISRNRLRLEVLPVLERNFPEAVSGICRSGALLSRWRDLQDQIALLSSDGSVSRRELLEVPAVLGALTLWQMAGKPRNGFEEFTKTIDWLSRGGKGNHILPGGKRLISEDEMVIVEARGSGRF
jgi:tRNA(Ile)-lysidine synthase